MSRYVSLAVLVLLAVGGQVEAAGGGAGGGATGLNRSSDLRARHGKQVPHRERDLVSILGSITSAATSADPVAAIVEDTSASAAASSSSSSSSTTLTPTSTSTSSSTESTTASEQVAITTVSSTSTTESALPSTTSSTSKETTSSSTSPSTTTSETPITSSTADSTIPTTSSSSSPTTTSAAEVETSSTTTTSPSANADETSTTSSAALSTSEESVASPTTSASVTESTSTAETATTSSIESEVATSTSTDSTTASPAPTTSEESTSASAAVTDVISSAVTDVLSSAASILAQVTGDLTTTESSTETSTFSTGSAQETAASQTTLITTSTEATLTGTDSTVSPTATDGSTNSATQSATDSSTDVPAPTTISTESASQTTDSATSLGTDTTTDTATVTDSATSSEITPSPLAAVTSILTLSSGEVSSIITSEVVSQSQTTVDSGASESATASASASATESEPASPITTGVASESATTSLVITGSESATASESAPAAEITTAPLPSESSIQSGSFNGSSSSSDYAPPPPSTSAVASSTSSDTNDVWYPTQSQLVLPLAATTTMSESSTSDYIETGTGSSYIPVPTVAPIPVNLPSVILPATSSDGASTDSSADAHAEDTLVSLLFSDALAWTFVANNSEATAQVMLYTPILVETALALNSSGASTYALKAYQPASINGVASPVLTTWVGYVPTALVADLQAQIKASNSAFYNQSGIPGEIANQVNKAFPIVNSFSATTGAASSSSSSSGSSLSSRNRDIIIGVTVSIGGTLWILLVVWVYRKMRRNAKADIHRRMSMNPTLTGRALANVNMMSQTSTGSVSGAHARSSSVDIDGRPSSFYAFSPPSINDRSSTRPQSRDMSINSSNGGGPGAIGSGRFSSIYRALGGGGTGGGRPISPESPTNGPQAAAVASSMTRRRQAPNAPISAPRNFQHILSDPVNPFSNPIADTYQQSSYQRPHAPAPPAPYKASGSPSPFYPTPGGGGGRGGPSRIDPFSDSNAVQGHSKVQRKPFLAADISGPVLRESSLGF